MHCFLLPAAHAPFAPFSLGGFPSPFESLLGLGEPVVSSVPLPLDVGWHFSPLCEDDFALALAPPVLAGVGWLFLAGRHEGSKSKRIAGGNVCATWLEASLTDLANCANRLLTTRWLFTGPSISLDFS